MHSWKASLPRSIRGWRDTDRFGKDQRRRISFGPQSLTRRSRCPGLSGGYDVLEVNETDPLSLTSWVRARKTQEVVLLAIQVRAEDPERISAVGFTIRESRRSGSTS